MRTSEEIYHRVRWDARFDPARFVLGVGMRGRPPKRVPLPAFVPGGEIPWHRIVFVEADGELVWDRASGVDRIDESEAGRVLDPRRLHAPFFTAKSPFAWDGLAWSPVRTVQDGLFGDGRLRVLTWNTLWDRYDADRIDTAGRRPRLIEELRSADADVIALQEVEAGLLTLLLATPWVRTEYVVSAIDGREVDSTGLLLLSRIPVREAGFHDLGPHKAVSAFVVETAAGVVAVATTHLTSDHSDRGAEIRVTELAAIFDGLSDVDCPLVLLGDFNDGTSMPAEALQLTDAWAEVHGLADQTPTFDPVANPLAAISSLTGRASRIDRVLVRGLRPVNASLRRAPVSDHYGVEAELLVGKEDGDVLDIPPTARTAVAWLPPDLPEVAALRRRHDPQFDRWPAHVNLLFGFVPESEFERAIPLLAAAVAQVPPFSVRLDGVHTFGHRHDATIWLDPVAPEWTELRSVIARPFPACGGRDFTPHLTLGRSKDAQTVAAECAARLSPVDAQVGELVVLSRRADEPMRVRARIALGTGTVGWIPDASGATVAESASVDAIVDRVAAALDAAVVHVVGSQRTGTALADSDVDLVAAVRGIAVTGLTDAPGITDVRPVVGARVPGTRMVIDGRKVDLALVDTGDLDPAEVVGRRAELGSAAAIALSAVTDAEALSGVNTTVVRSVKAWARARGLDSAPFGGLPGIAWAIMAASVDSSSLVDFFAQWAAWDWRDAVALRGRHTAYGPVTIMTPTEPIRSCTEQVGLGMRDLLTQELYRAWEIAATELDPLPRLLESPPLHQRHAAWAVLAAADDGLFRGRVRALLALLEPEMPDVHAWPRPFAPHTYAIGLGRTPVTADGLTALASAWSARTTVEWRPSGDVPTLR
ncbi:RNA repair domain-containing protein [Kutzneria chonburiensis]|uniref:RNA repair domain-containing protein n=1 Tax=Kutzneria chonburiensis TaxID=1483604 RepID=A0ABV6MTC5_9PSEU|nr:RNA repair domain-containing protein [Kutzneria chonburiensis]